MKIHVDSLTLTWNDIYKKKKQTGRQGNLRKFRAGPGECHCGKNDIYA